MDLRAPRLDRRTPRFLTARFRPDVPLITRQKQNKDIPPGERLGCLLGPDFTPFLPSDTLCPATGFRLPFRPQSPFSSESR
jgi:hypothetical protein